MTRKDYELIAEHLRIAEGELVRRFDDRYTKGARHTGCLAIQTMKESVADALAFDNARFDRERFMTAASYDQWRIAKIKAKNVHAA